MPRTKAPNRRAIIAWLSAALGIGASLAQAQTGSRLAPITPAPAFSAEQLAAPARGDWLTNGGNLFNQRYSQSARIDKENVGRLKGVWRTHLNGSGLEPQYSGEAQPIVHDGVVYVITGADDVFALSVETGEILWSYEAGLDPEITTVCCG